MANKQQQQQLLLHELLKQDQEPFHLNSYISQKRSHFKQTSLQLKKRPLTLSESTLKPGNIYKHACFLSFMNSTYVTKSPLSIMSPSKSPNGTVFLHIPSKTATHLAEAAMRIQKRPVRRVGLGFFGSFLKRLKDRNTKSKKRVIVDKENGGTNIVVEDLNDASTSYCEVNCDVLELFETRFCVSPFRFSVHQSPLSNGECTPEFCSPVGSPVKQVKENVDIPDSGNNVRTKEDEEEEKEQCSPVSVLDPPFEDDEQESGDKEMESYDLECSYANVQRAKEQLLCRLRRFEKLADLDPIELERKLLEGSESEENESENDELLLLYTSPTIDNIVAFNESTTVQHHSMKRSSDMNEEKNVVCLENKEATLGRFCKRLDFSKEVKFETIDMMIELDFTSELDGWKKFSEQGEEIMAEIELEVFGRLVEELLEELPY